MLHASMPRAQPDPACHLHTAVLPPWALAALRHGGQPGTTEIYASTRKTNPDLDAVRQQGMPATVSNAIKTQL